MHGPPFQLEALFCDDAGLSGEVLRHCGCDTLRALRLLSPRFRRAVDCHISKAEIPAGHQIPELLEIEAYLRKLPTLESIKLGYLTAVYRWRNGEEQNPPVELVTLDDVGAAALVRMYPQRMKSIDYSGNRLGRRACAALATADWPLMSKVNLSCNPIGATGAAALARARWPDLRTLTLESTDLNDSTSIAALLQMNQRGQAPAWASSLRTLDLTSNRFGSKGFEQLAAAAERLPLLESLNCDLCAHGVAALARGNFRSLRILDLAQNQVGCHNGEDAAPPAAQAAAQALSSAPWWPQLEELYLGNNDFGDRGVEELRLKRCTQLRALDLSDNNLSDASAALLGRWAAEGAFQRLEVLDLFSNYDMSCTGALLLLAPLPAEPYPAINAAAAQQNQGQWQQSKFPLLRSLDLCGLPLGAAFFEGLAAAGRCLPLLEELDVTSCDVQPEGVAGLLRCDLPALRCLTLDIKDIGGVHVLVRQSLLQRWPGLGLDLSDAI